MGRGLIQSLALSSWCCSYRVCYTQTHTHINTATDTGSLTLHCPPDPAAQTPIHRDTHTHTCAQDTYQPLSHRHHTHTHRPSATCAHVHTQTDAGCSLLTCEEAHTGANTGVTAALRALHVGTNGDTLECRDPGLISDLQRAHTLAAPARVGLNMHTPMNTETNTQRDTWSQACSTSHTHVLQSLRSHSGHWVPGTEADIHGRGL